MTNAEAIKRIRTHMAAHRIGVYPHILIGEALEKAIEALSAQPENTYVFPCQVGDTVFGIRRAGQGLKVVSGPVTEIYFTDGMEMAIVLKGLCRGKWNETIFGTWEEAEAERVRRIGGAAT